MSEIEDSLDRLARAFYEKKGIALSINDVKRLHKEFGVRICLPLPKDFVPEKK